MKKLLTLLLAFALGFAFTSCDKEDEKLDSKFVGTWQIYKRAFSNGDEDLFDDNSSSISRIVFNSDHTGKTQDVRSGEFTEVGFEWKLTDETHIQLHAIELDTTVLREFAFVDNDEIIFKIKAENEVVTEYYKRIE